MRTLYTRIIAIAFMIIICSALLAFIATNVYYHFELKPKNDKKLTGLAENIVQIYEKSDRTDLHDYLEELTPLGYQFYIMNSQGEAEQIGKAFRSYEIPESDIAKVLDGDIYHGIKHYPWRLTVTGFFDNELVNTVGVPLKDENESVALFVRPDTQQQFGEMRIFLSIMLVLLLALSFLFILFSTRYIVRPIKQLARATNAITDGQYDVDFKTKRRDELGRLATDFQTMAKSLSKTEEKRQEFVSNVSHEIQSPLTSINGFSQALREKDIPEELRDEYLQIIEKESKRLSLLSKQLLTLSFLDRDEAQSNDETFNVAHQLTEVVQTLTYQWEEKEIAVELDVKDAYVYGDAKMLQQVWMNLISNAIAYTDKGGQIMIQTAQTKQDVSVTIQDSGIGIQKEHLPYIFERFYKVDAARVRTSNSTGLGLAIVKKIIDLHGATITVESTEGEGTTFICTFSKV